MMRQHSSRHAAAALAAATLASARRCGVPRRCGFGALGTSHSVLAGARAARRVQVRREGAGAALSSRHARRALCGALSMAWRVPPAAACGARVQALHSQRGTLGVHGEVGAGAAGAGGCRPGGCRPGGCGRGGAGTAEAPQPPPPAPAPPSPGARFIVERSARRGARGAFRLQQQV